MVRAIVKVVVAAWLVGRPAPTWAAETVARAESDGLWDQLRQLEALAAAQQARIHDLQRRAEEAGLDAPGMGRTEEIRRLVRELLTDSGFRESLYPDLQQVGYDRGFYIRSADEQFLLKIGGWMHVRWTGLNRQTDNPRRAGRQKQDDINGIDIEDLRVIFSGHIHTPKFRYTLVITGDTDQEHAWRTYRGWLTYEFDKAFQVSAGLLKLPFGRQEPWGKAVLQFVDRSLANETFKLTRAAGAMLHGTVAERLTYAVAVVNGLNNQDDRVTQEELDTNFAYVARLEAHILGKPIRTESDLAYSKDPQMEVGLSFAQNDDNGDRRTSGFYPIPDRVRRGRGIGPNGPVDLTGTDLTQFGADAAFRCRGFSATAEYWLRAIDGESELSAWERLTGRDDWTHAQGGYFQAGYFIIPRRVELAARLGGVWDNSGGNSWEYAFVVNYFPWGSYNTVLQVDFTRVDEATTNASEANWSQNDEVNMVRAQLQVRF